MLVTQLSYDILRFLSHLTTPNVITRSSNLAHRQVHSQQNQGAKNYLLLKAIKGEVGARYKQWFKSIVNNRRSLIATAKRDFSDSLFESYQKPMTGDYECQISFRNRKKTTI